MVHSPMLEGKGRGSESPELWSLWVAWPGLALRPALLPDSSPCPLHKSLGWDMVARSGGWPGVWWGWGHLGADASAPPQLLGVGGGTPKVKLGAAPKNT